MKITCLKLDFDMICGNCWLRHSESYIISYGIREECAFCKNCATKLFIELRKQLDPKINILT